MSAVQPPAPPDGAPGGGLQARFLTHGGLERLDVPGLMLNLFVGNEVEGGPSNLWLRWHRSDGAVVVPLLGPGGALAPRPGCDGRRASGRWNDLALQLELRLSQQDTAWYWHLQIDNLGAEAMSVDLVHVQDVGLASWSTIRMNEYYVSQYVDLTPLEHTRCGWVLAARQNQAVDGRTPWVVVGSLRCGAAYATDGLDVHGLAARVGDIPVGVRCGLPSRRRQHEHAVLAIQDTVLTVAPGARAHAGFFGRLLTDHPQASGAADLEWVDRTLADPQAQPVPAAVDTGAGAPVPGLSRFTSAALLTGLDLDTTALDRRFDVERRHEEWHEGVLLSFFHGEQAHVVLRAKELLVQRPHGHILRSGLCLVPDETALTSTVWMGGVFHSMLTQGHVGINCFVSTVRSWLGLFRSQGQRVFVRVKGAWHQLGVPSAFEMLPQSCRWIYKYDGGLVEVRSSAHEDPHRMRLEVHVLDGPDLALLVSHHVVLAGDDAAPAQPLALRLQDNAVFVGVGATGALAQRFPGGGFSLSAGADTRFERIGGDELLFEDGRSRGQPFVCIASAPTRRFVLDIEGFLVRCAPPPNADTTLPVWHAPAGSVLAADARRAADTLPWYRHNALVHYLAPRGLEQFSGGGWGTRDVCQGPLEMLLALQRPQPVRDLLTRVFAAQNDDGDWPQWFMFFERERDLRAGDSHGDIVFWPLLGLARYLLASEDASVLEQRLPFYGAPPSAAVTIEEHVGRSIELVRARSIPGTSLIAYGHGDWNDSLQPVDPSFREQLCSSWTVTLHHHTWTLLARAFRRAGRAALAASLESEAARILADFQRLLVVDGVVSGYTHFGAGAAPQRLLHPSDGVTGVHYSLLPMVHAVLGEMLTPQQARDHVALIEAHLLGPDGARLFDRPMTYRGGPATLFQRAETSAFFGREIGVMYMHAHLRYAEMLAHLGDSAAFFDAMCRAQPLGLNERVPSAALRQSNCYYSSSDAAFADRYEASRDYGRVGRGSIALDGGWRIYSSGPGIGIGLWVNRFLGVRRDAGRLLIDPVIPSSLSGLRARLEVAAGELEVVYRCGPLGHGPQRLVLNGSPLAFERDANAYRCGGAAVAWTDVQARLRTRDNLLEVDLL